MPTSLRSPVRAAILVAAALPAGLAAQTPIVGVVRDSLTGGPFAGAVVQLVARGTSGLPGRTVAVDTAGRFRIPDVAPGRYLLGFLHPRLDSLGMVAPVRTIDVVAGMPELQADLALPSAQTIADAICGGRRDTTGLLLGRVLDAERSEPVVAGTVLVRWTEVRVDAAGARRVRLAVRAPVGDGGRYVACGVPTNVPVLVQATAGAAPEESATSGAVELTFAPASPLLHRDILVSPATPRPAAPGAASEERADSAAPATPLPVPRATARLTGRVRRPDGQPVGGARVVVRGARAADSVATARPDGTFRLDALPGGTYAVEAFAIGFTPVRAAADLRPGRTATLDIALGPRVGTLETVAVYAAPTRGKRGFSTRMEQGFGRFLTAERIQRSGAYLVTNLLMTVPGLRGGHANGRPVIVGRDDCVPEVYLDGVLLSGGASELDRWVRPADVGGIEVYADPTLAPPQYSHGNCATVLVWTQGALR
ncbi:MAG TPA: carboxypeptidase regulatory-like domain-containing protein [Gemmatimonadaceae bacterium]|nr:carboxypeptidase regulatory-like domain-containing protein [Gemmatimonadaceae bacterium]